MPRGRAWPSLRARAARHDGVDTGSNVDNVHGGNDLVGRKIGGSRYERDALAATAELRIDDADRRAEILDGQRRRPGRRGGIISARGAQPGGEEREHDACDAPETNVRHGLSSVEK
jgi:hypothetical protein